MNDLSAAKRAARAAARRVRALAHAASPGAARQAAGHALALIGAQPGRPGIRVVSAYLAIRDELDPMPAMLALHGLDYRLCVPVIEAAGAPLRFRAWIPGTPLAAGPFGIPVPAAGDWLDPDLLLVPLLAFDARCRRLGYGGGFYDRTLAGLRARAPRPAFGLAYAGQQVAAVPSDATDAVLDAVVTPEGAIFPQQAPSVGIAAT